MSGLSTELFREVRPEFFRILGSVSARLYVDVLDALETEFSERNEGLVREEALAIIAEVIEAHPDWTIEPAEDAADVDSWPAREKARLVLDRLVAAGWLEVQTGSNWQKVLYFDPHGSTLLATLRKIAHPDAAVFTDKLVAMCAVLGNHAELARQPWEQIKSCKEMAQSGISELRTMQKSVERFIRKQLEAQTLGQNLNLVFDQYAQQVGHACYAELVRARLSLRLSDARERLQTLLGESDLLQKMQAEVMRRDAALDAATAMARVRNELERLSWKVESIVPLADSIDGRTAEFMRRSLARFRYLLEVVGERRGQVKALFEHLNRTLAGRRFSDLEDGEEFPSMLLPEARLLAGRDSLYEPTRRRTLEENKPLEDDLSEDQRERTRLQMENALRDSLTVSRANRFVAKLPGGKGSRLASADLPLRDEDDLADLVALVLHAESSEARYTIEVPRVVNDCGDPEHDHKVACRIEKFFLIKK